MVEHIADAKFLLNKHALIDNDFKYRRSYCDSRTKIEFFTGLPRLAIELFLITAVFAAFVFAVKNFSGEIILSAIPQVFLFIIAAQKSIPVLQRIFLLVFQQLNQSCHQLKSWFLFWQIAVLTLKFR